MVSTDLPIQYSYPSRTRCQLVRRRYRSRCRARHRRLACAKWETIGRDQSDYGLNAQGIGPMGVATWDFGNIVMRNDLPTRPPLPP